MKSLKNRAGTPVEDLTDGSWARGCWGRRLSSLSSITAAVVLLCAATVAHAGGSPQTIEVSGVGGEYLSGSAGGGADPDFEVPGGGYGFLSRIGHIAGETVGRDDSITHIGLAPYLFHEETMLFGDLRLFRTNEGRTGGSAGMGLRHYLAEQDAILGVAGYYDSDDSRGVVFKQLGASVELLTRMFDVRANVYVPIETTERVVGTSIIPNSERFSGNRLLFDGRTDFSAAANGADVMVSTPVPGEIPEMFNLEISGGGYHYQARQDGLTDMWGYKLRTDADVFKRILHMFVEMTSDRVTDTNVVFGASLNYYHGFENKRRLQDRQFYRMSEWVRRNFTVVTIDDFAVDPGLEARNPDTGDPYFFAHVRNIPGNDVPPPVPMDLPDTGFNFPSPFGDGTVERPFQFIQEGQAEIRALPFLDQPNGVVYVHGNSEFTGDDAVVVMEDGEVLLGEGEGDNVFQSLPILGFTGNATLPTIIEDGSVPLLDMASADAVTLANDNTFSGFNITNGTANGITINGGMGGMISDVMISDAVGDGVLMTGASETFRFDRVAISDVVGAAFHVDGGNASIIFADADRVTLDTPSIVNSSNEALLIENTVGGSVIFSDAIIDDNAGGAGIRLINNAGTITLGEATIDGTVMSSDPTSVQAGLEITRASGSVTLLENITITDAGGVGFLVNDLLPGGRIIPSANLTINERNDVGADFVNIGGTPGSTDGVFFSPNSNLVIGALNGATADHPAIRFSTGSTGTVSLNDFTIANSLSDGILIGDPTGANINADGALFRVIGSGTIGSTGRIVTPDVAGGTDGAAIRIAGAAGLEDPTDVSAQGLITSNSRVGRGIHIENTSGEISFANVVVNNNADTPSTASALFINDTTSSIGFGGPFGFGGFTANGNTGLEPAVDIMNVADPGSVDFSILNILDANGVLGLEVIDTASLDVNDGIIDVAGEQALDIQNTTIDVTFESVSSSNSPTFGMRVLDSPGEFTITGDGEDSSGGEIRSAAIAGALFDNTDEVSITSQDYTTNAVGVVAQNMNDSEDDFLFLDAMQFNDNLNQSVLTNDVRNITIEDSIFTEISPGSLGDENQFIELRVTDNPNLALEAANIIADTLDFEDPDFITHVYVIQRNEFVDVGTPSLDDAVLIRTLDTGTGDPTDSSLELAFDDNLFSTFNRTALDEVSALNIVWNGFLTAAVRRNEINMGGFDGQTGIKVTTLGNDTFTDINVANNVVTAFANELTTGISFNLQGPSAVRVDSNLINFATIADTTEGSTNVGLEFQFLDGNNSIAVVNNLILMDEGRAVSVLRLPSPVGARSSFLFQFNELGQNREGLPFRFPDEGLIFNSVTGLLSIGGIDNLASVQFSPGSNPPFIDPNDVFSVNPNNVTGSIQINGQFLP